MKLPDVTEISRWNPQPGDRLLIYVEEEQLTREQAEYIEAVVRRKLQLPDDFPLCVVGPQIHVSVVHA